MPSFIDSWWRMTGVMGLGFAVFFIVGMVASGSEPPAFDDDIADIRAFWVEDADGYLLGDFFAGIAFVFFLLPFIAGLKGVLDAGDRSNGMWPRASFAGGLLAVALGGAASIAWGGLALGEAEGLDDSTLRFAMYVDAYGFTLLALGLALFTAAASMVIARSGVLWRWLAIVGGLSAILNLIGTLWTIEGDQESLLGLLGLIGTALAALFVIIASIQLVMMKTPPTPSGDAP